MSVDGLNTGIQVFLEKKNAILSQLLILLICIVQMKPFHKVYFQCFINLVCVVVFHQSFWYYRYCLLFSWNNVFGGLQMQRVLKAV